jgi:branched-chain amino acid transport system substrate-binding protein
VNDRRYRRTRSRSGRLLPTGILPVTLLLTGLLAAGCSNGNAGPDSAPGVTMTAITSTTDVDLDMLNPKDVGPQAALTFLGVEEGPAEGEPVRIGFLNQGTGTGSAPEALTGAQAAVHALNTELRGIRGRPVELVVCTTASGENETACAAKLRAAGVTLVITGRTPVDPAGMTRALGDTPVTGVDPRSVAEERNPHAAYYVIGRRGIANTAAQWTAAQITGPVLVVTDEASGEPELLESALAGLYRSGRIAKQLDLPTRDAIDGAKDRDTVRQAIAETGATTVILLTGPGGCVAVAEATRTEPDAITVVTAGTCSQRSVHDVLGDWTPAWTHVAGGPDLENYDTDPQTAYYRDRFRDHAGPQADWTGLANSTFSAFMNTARALNAASDLTAPAVVEALRANNAPGYAAGKPLPCDLPGLPARCLNEARLYEYTGGRHWKLAPGGAGIRITAE